MLCFGLNGCGDRGDPYYPEGEQPYPQPYPQQQPYPQTYPQPAPAPYPAPYPAPATSQGTPTMIPGIMKMPDGTCTATPPALQPGTQPQPIAVPCPPQ